VGGAEQRFQAAFATTVAEHGGVPLVQIDPTRISLTAIAAGRYDSYLDAYARAVVAYRRPVILSFGHEMNGDWYTSTFPPLFGPTIAAVRRLTSQPILIAETAAAPAAGQPAKIADLFAGVRLYQLLGFVWFDSAHVRDWRLSRPEAITAFRRAARAFRRPAP
jgi:hypothetical protein